MLFLESTTVPPLLLLCLGKTWPLDTVVCVDDAVFDDFGQVLHLNLTGIGSGLSFNSTILCEQPNAGFTDLDS